jgi:hypothetical protein
MPRASQLRSSVFHSCGDLRRWAAHGTAASHNRHSPLFCPDRRAGDERAIVEPCARGSQKCPFASPRRLGQRAFHDGVTDFVAGSDSIVVFCADRSRAAHLPVSYFLSPVRRASGQCSRPTLLRAHELLVGVSKETSAQKVRERFRSCVAGLARGEVGRSLEVR